METRLQQQPIEEITSDVLAIVTFEKEAKDGGLETETAKKVDALTGGWLGEIYSSGEFAGKPMELAVLHRPSGVKSKKLLVIGGGKADKFTPAELRKVSGAVVRALKSKSTPAITVALDAKFSSALHVTAAVEGAVLGDFESDRYKTDKDKNTPVESFSLAVAQMDESLERARQRGQIAAEAQNYARDMVGMPGNHMTPTALAECASQTAADYGLDCEVLGPDQLKELGMGALLGVAQGSAEPPALIILRYKPAAETSSKAHLGLVGKGVTFDTGGISIKPSKDMDQMKSDMAGGASVIGAMRAIAQLKPSIPVTALIPAVENMPGSRAQRPGDIVTSLSGKTIEVLNTDAEGRLILADALTYAQRLGCTHLVDAATLTGAIVVALGHVYTGVFTSDDAMRQKVMDSANAEGDKMWHMPLDDDYKEALKSAYADIPNIGNRWGGAITAAMFLKEFADQTPWVHLDIAGTAWLDDSKPFMTKGPSGVPVRTLVNLALNWKV